MALEDLAKYGGAAPRGVQQQNQRDQSSLGQLAQYGSRNPAWQTGGATGTTENGWNTPFYEDMFKQRKEAEEQNKLSELAFQKNYTGVVTYRQTRDGQTRNFGDVYENGQLKGNLLNGTYGVNEAQGYQILAQLTLDAKEQKETYESALRDPSILKKTVDARAEQSAKEAEAWAGSQAFQGEVQRVKDDWDDGTTTGLTVGAGAAGGAAVGAGAGATIGAFFGGIGAAPGALIGGLIGTGVGALGAWLNQDEIEDQAARAAVQTEMAGEQFGGPGALATGLRTWGGVGTSLINPAGNIVRGATDAIAGELGDEKSAYYEMEDRPWLLTGLNLGAGLIDAAAQFASPLGQTLFMTSMGTQVGGGVGQLALQGGATFDERRGDFHAPEDAGQMLAAVGNVGIDAVQMIGGRGIFNAGRRSIANEGTVLRREWSKEANDWATVGIQPGRQTVGGRTFYFAPDGSVSRVRTNMTSFFAPSEAVTWLGARAQALVKTNATRVPGGRATREEFNEALYRAARDIDQGTNLAQTSLLNAFGEGAEEAVQSVLEPLSHGWNPSPAEIVESFFMGAAMGAGMSIGARFNRVSSSERQRFLANVELGAQGLPAIDKAKWNAMSTTERAALAPKPESLADRQLIAQAEAVLQGRETTSMMLAPASERIMDTALAVNAQEAANALASVEGAYVISGHRAADIPAHEVRTSIGQVMELLESAWTGIQEKLNSNPSEEDRANLQATLEAARELDVQLRNYMQIAFTHADPAARAMAIRRFNQLLQQAWNSTSSADAAAGRFSPLAQAVSVILARDPNNSEGSFQMLLPQALEHRTDPEAQSAPLEVAFGILEAIGGDFDGDKMISRVRLATDTPMVYRDLRIGMNLLQATDAAVKIGTRETEGRIIEKMGAANWEGGSARANAEATALELQLWLQNNFARVPNIKDIAREFKEDILNSIPDAKKNLYNKLFGTTNVEIMRELALEGTTNLPVGTNFPLAIDQKINQKLQAWKDAFAFRHDPNSINLTEASSIPADSVAATRLASEGVTPWETMGLETAGTDAFREAQKIYYNLYRSDEAGIQAWDYTSDASQKVLQGFMELYAAINSGLAQPSANERLSGDALVKGALRILTSLAERYPLRNKGEIMAMGALAGLAIPDFRQEPNGEYRYHGVTTIGQYAIRESALQLRANSVLLEGLHEDDLADLDMIIDGPGLSAGDAYFRLFDGVPATALLGEAGANLKVNLSMGQIRAEYASMHSSARRLYRDILRGDFRAKARGDLPYSFEQFDAGDANPYSVFVAALTESVDKELSYDPKTKKTSGKLWDQDQRRIDDLEQGLKTAATELRRMKDLHKRNWLGKSGKLSVEAVMELAAQNPDFARNLMGLIPAEVTTQILRPLADGRVAVPRWLAEVLTMENSKQAAYIYFQQVTLAQIQLLSKKDHPFESQDRLMQLWLRLREQPGENAIFQEIFYTSKSITEFLDRINARYAQTAPPQLAFHRESTRFDADLSDGGWSMKLDGTEMRDAISKFRSAANRLHSSVQGEYQRFRDNQEYFDLLRSEMDAIDRGEQSTVGKVRLLGQRLLTSARMPRPLGPQGLMIGPLAMAHTIQTNLTDKGKAVGSLLHYGADAVRGGTATRGIGFEQGMDSLLASDSEDLASNAPILAGKSLRLSDQTGRPVEWIIPNDPLELAREFLQQYEEVANRPMLEAIFFPTVYETQQDGRVSQQMLTDMTLRDFVTNDTYQKLLNFDQTGSFNTQVQYFAQLNAFTSQNGAPNEALLVLSDILQARLTSAKKSLSLEEVANMQRDVMQSLVRLFRAIGEAPHDAIIEQINSAFDQLDEQLFKGSTALEKSTINALKTQLKDSIVGQITDETSDADLAGIERYTQQIDSFFETTQLEQFLRQYMPNWSDPADVSAKKSRIIEELRGYSGIAQQTYSDAVKRLLNPALPKDADGNPYDAAPNSEADQAIWNEAASALITVRLQQTIAPSGSNNRVPVLPKDAIKAWTKSLQQGTRFISDGNARFYDPSFRYIFDQLFDTDSVLYRSVKEFHILAKGPEGQGKSTIPTSEIFDAIVEIMDPTQYGPWTNMVARRSIDARNRINSAGVDWQIALAGIAYDKQATAMAASERTFADPGAGALHQFTLSEEGLQTLLDPGRPDIDLADRASLVSSRGEVFNDGLGILNGRFVSEITLSYVDPATGEQVSRNLLDRAQVPLVAGFVFEGHDTAGRSVPDLGYRHTSVDAIRNSLNSIPDLPLDATLSISMFHPADQPARGFANNLYFEGVVGQGVSDRQSSLLAELWMGNSGLNPEEQTRALKSMKEATTAYKEAETVGLDEVQMLEENFRQDLYGVLRAKADRFFNLQLGHIDRMDPTYYGAVIKELKLRHLVRIPAEEGFELLSVEDVIAGQRAGTLELPPEAELVTLSQRQRNTLFNEQGVHGIAVAPVTPVTTNLDGVDRWDGDISRLAAKNLPSLLSAEQGSIKNTLIHRRTSLQQLRVRPLETRPEFQAHRSRMVRAQQRKDTVHAARRDYVDASRSSYERALKEVLGDANSQNVTMPWLALTDMGVNLLLPPNLDPRDERNAVSALFEKFRELWDASPNTRGFVYDFGQTLRGTREEGILHGVGSLRETSEKHHAQLGGDPVLDDLIVVKLETAREPKMSQAEVLDKIETHLKALTATNATLVLSYEGGGGGLELRNHAANHLRALGWQPVTPGSKGAWRPPSDQDGLTQSLLAYYSKQGETDLVSTDGLALAFLDKAFFGEENMAVVNNRPGVARLSQVFVRALAPVANQALYNIAATEAQALQVKMNLDQLLESSEMLEHLTDLSLEQSSYEGRSEKRSSLDRDAVRAGIQAALSRAAEHYSTSGTWEQLGLPAERAPIGPGDFIVKIGPDGLILSRYGHEELVDDAHKKQFAATPDSWLDQGGLPIAITSPRRKQNATTYTGSVRKWTRIGVAGLELEESVPLELEGDKITFEENGMKYILVSLDGTELEIPAWGPFQGWDINYFAAWSDSLSKESFSGVVDNARDAIKYFGMDFSQAFAKTFLDSSLTPEAWEALSPDERAVYRSRVNDILSAVVKNENHSLMSTTALMSAFSNGGGTAMAKASVGAMLQLPVFQDIQASAKTLATTSWDSVEPEAQVALAMLIAATSETVYDPTVLMSSTGLNTAQRENDVRLREMPEFFTSIFDQAAQGSPLRDWFFERLNERLKNVATPGEFQGGYELRDDYTFFIRSGESQKVMEGYLQIARAGSAGANPVFNSMAFHRAETQQLSWQRTRVNEEAMGVSPYIIAQMKRMAKHLDTDRFEALDEAQDVYRLLQGVALPPTPPGFATRVLTQAEQEELSIGREKYLEMEAALDESDWTEEQRVKAAEIRVEIINYLGWEESDLSRVDAWVRAYTGKAKERSPETISAQGLVSFNMFMEATNQIQENLRLGQFPTTGVILPVFSSFDTVRLWTSYNAGRGLWAPASKNLDWSSLETFVNVVLGELVESRGSINATHFPALKGYLQTFRDLGKETFVNTPISIDTLGQLMLLDPTTNEMVISPDSLEADLLRDPEVSHPYTASLTQLVEGREMLTERDRQVGEIRDARWHRRKGVPEQVSATMQELKAGYGRQFRTHGTGTTAVVRNLLNIRGALTMLNPLLHVASLGELWRNNVIEGAVELISGASTGRVAQAASAITGQDRELMQLAERTAAALAHHSGWRQMVNAETLPHEHPTNAKAIERFTHRAMEMGGRWQDATYGIPSIQLARRYVRAALLELRSQSSQTTLTPQQLLSQLGRNPLWLRDSGHVALHHAGTKQIEQVRTLKPSVMTLMFRGAMDPLTNSPLAGRNLISNIGLKIPLMFAPFAFNVTTNILGLQGLNALAAVALAGRTGGKRGGRFQAALQGVAYDPDIHGVDFINESLESTNLANTFIRAGVTHTGLAGLGLLFQGLGLSGEDEEDRRRRRAAQFQGAGYVYDPRRIENDWRNADAMYFDNLPDLGFLTDFLKETTEVVGPGEGVDGQGTSMAELHWTLKFFLSPVQGIERWLNTGNFNHLRWGFMDAIGEMPLINAGLWDATTAMSQELYEAAMDAEASGTPEKTGEAYGYLLNSVSMYERMLMESSFLNSIYVATDKYDRDPWTLVDVDASGRIVRDNTNQPMTTQAMDQFLNEEGDVAERRVSPDSFEGTLRSWAENRMGVAFFGSLFSGSPFGGGGGSMWRQDQAIRTRSIDREELTDEGATQIILSMWDEEHGLEIPNDAGATAIIRGLQAGLVKPGDPALENVFIPFETRVRVQERLTAELMQERLDAGLDHATAERLTREVMFGSSTNPYVTPLWEVIWSKGQDFEGAIGYSPVARYRQLNTTYVAGPDGKFYATGIGRDKLNNFFGLSPLQRFNTTGDAGLDRDQRLNSQDPFSNINTGMRNLERVDDSWANPTEEDILDAIKASTDAIIDAIKDPSWNRNGGYGSSYSRGGGGGGGGGGYSYRLNSPERNNPIYSSNDPYIRADDPIIRRATIRRERYTSQRGRLNQWQ